MSKLKKVTALLLSATLIITMSSSAIFAGTQKAETGTAVYPKKDSTYAARELIVVYKENASSANISLHMKNSVAKLHALSDTKKMAVVRLSKGTDLEEAIAEYADSPIVDYVQPNYLYRLPAEVASPSTNETADKDWHFDSINMSGVKTRYNEVAETSGTKKVRVAVLDTGVDIQHPDLQQCLNKDLSVKTNAKENTVSPLTGDSDIFDGHGTHVFGIIGATADNGLGAKGIASYVMGSKLDLVAVDIFDFYDTDEFVGNNDGIPDYEEYGADSADIIQGLDYARKIKADVINLSIGSYVEDKAEKEAIARCIHDGIVVVSAAGNEGTAMECYPSDYPGVLSVIATDESGEATDWTNYGASKEISAPGENIYSTIPMTLTSYDEFSGKNTGKIIETSGYSLMSGTSMASPVVTGITEIVDLEEENKMKTRVISGFCMVPLLAFVYLGGYWLTAMCILIALMGVKELFNGFKAMDIHPSLPIAYGATFVLYLIHGFFPQQHEFILAWLAASVMASSVYIFKINERKVEDAMATMLGIVYVVFFSYHVTLVDQTQEYANLVWLVLISAFATDIFAYFSGYLFGRHGRHKLCPNLSPKKTWEGAIGGTLGSIICCGLFGYLVMPRIWVHCLFIGCVCAILSQCGDLTASAYKRKMGIKDYGTLIPGHGGIMDRFDSVLFTAPVVYYYIVLVLL